MIKPTVEKLEGDSLLPCKQATDRLQRKHEFIASGTTEALHPKKKNTTRRGRGRGRGTKLPVFLVYIYTRGNW